ncbi:PspC domain-containing protein [Streptomyces roseicoloratus]|uniref:PspC domain-containing protein n=1 Tax=Streptomyces roseicoloratus TaxID=2508722 RepID=A0ABY9RU28_9ACTN|nr:PspC domain-containing protein [Streptomyces roseicoloratus]WMX45452.1 PspC domain-containing protein [Streptomyces roseicoloratus]
MTSSTPSQHEAPPPAEARSAPPLRRSRGQKVVAGVCGGLGRYFDLDPVIFRVALGVLAATGGIGLIFYGFAWLAVPLADEEENEGRRLLTGRVSGSSLSAVLMALVGSGIFLSMLRNGGTMAFALVLTLGVSGAAVWSRRRPAVAATAEEGGRIDPAAALAVAEAPPETKAPPLLVERPSWWRDPIVKDGSTGKVAIGYLWGPHGIVDRDGKVNGEVPKPGGQWGTPVDDPVRPVPSVRTDSRPVSVGGLVFLLALLAGGLGTGLSWEGHPLGTSLQIGLAAALGVIGLGLLVSSFLGRTGFGTLCLMVLTAGLLTVASALPKEISTVWARETWRPATVAAVQPQYELGTGVGTLDLSHLVVPAGTTVSTRVGIGAGKVKVIVPRNATVTLRARVGLGDLMLPPEHVARPPAAPAAPTAPTAPSAPAAPAAPTAPTAPSAPAAPTALSAPTAPAAPGTPVPPARSSDGPAVDVAPTVAVALPAASAPVTPAAPTVAPPVPPTLAPPEPTAEPAGDIDIAPDLDETRTLVPPPGVTPGGTVDLFLEVGLGQVEVVRAAA